MKKVSWPGNSLSGAYFHTLYNNKHNSIKSPTKKAEFQALIDLHKPDIVLGCESKLDSTIPTYSVFPSTYDIFRKDWTLHGGGVFIGVRNDIIATEQVHLDVHNCEIITVSIKFAKSKTLLLSSYYRPPAFDTNALDLLDDVLSRTYSPNPPPPVIFTGDFNCGGIDWSTRNLTPHIAQACDQALLDLSDKYGVFADAPRFRPYIRPLLLLQSWYQSLAASLQDWYFPEVHAETPPENLSVSQGRFCRFKGKLNYSFFRLSIYPPRV